MKKAFSSCGLAYGLIFKVQVKSDDCDPCKIVKSELSVPNQQKLAGVLDGYILLLAYYFSCHPQMKYTLVNIHLGDWPGCVQLRSCFLPKLSAYVYINRVNVFYGNTVSLSFLLASWVGLGML